MCDTDVNLLFKNANLELEKASVWFRANKLTLNVKKTKFMLFSEKSLQLQDVTLKIGNQTIQQVGSNCKEKYFKFVGHFLDDKLSWQGHVEHVCKKLAGANFAINSSKNFLPYKIRKSLYYSLFESHLNYGILLWGCTANKNIRKIENMQKRCIRNVALKSFKAHTEPIFKDLSILKFPDILSYCKSNFMNQYRNKKLPESFNNIFTDITCTDESQTRHNSYNFLNKPAIRQTLENFPFKCILSTWNSLEIDIKATSDHEEFQKLLKEKYLNSYSAEIQCFNDNCFSCNHGR